MGFMQKTGCLVDENSISFQMFLIMLSFIALGSENQISVLKQCQSNTQMSVLFFLGGGGGGHAQKSKFGGNRIFIRHLARFNFSRLSLAFILKYYPILNVVKR